MPPDTSLRWSLVIPVKVLALAKSRLTGLAGPRRAELALAMAADTVAATVACPVVDTVIVVTDDAAAAADLSGLGAVVVPDEPGDGLNPALTFGAAQADERWPGRGRGGLAADLPALGPAELGRALAVAAGVPEAFVADAAGTGHHAVHGRAGRRVPPEVRAGVARGPPVRRRGGADASRPGRAAARRGHRRRPAGRGPDRAGPAHGRRGGPLA